MLSLCTITLFLVPAAAAAANEINDDLGKHAIVRFDPPVWGETEIHAATRSIFSQLYSSLVSQAPKDLFIVQSVDCGQSPEICVQSVGRIPTEVSLFGRRWKGEQVFERYDGPQDMKELMHFVHFKTPKKKKDTRKGADTVNSDHAHTVQFDVPRPKGRGVYIYRDEAWTRVLDEACGVTTIPLFNEDTSKEDEGADVPVLNAEANPNEIRDPGYFAILRPFLRHTIQAGLEVADPEQAHFFLVPFDFDRSYSLGDCVLPSGKGISTHLDRVEAVMKGLQSSKYYRRRGGSDHVLVLMHFFFCSWRRRSDTTKYGKNQELGNGYFPQKYMDVVRSATILKYIGLPLKLDGAGAVPNRLLDEVSHFGFQPSRGTEGNVWWIQGEDWRCTAVVPNLTPPTIENMEFNKTFEAWLDRPYLLHYRGNGAKKPIAGAQKLHELVHATRDLFPAGSVLISDRHGPREEYAEELVKSKFCLVVRGDDPMRSRFFDAVASGCIPLLINDGWNLVAAPFADWVDYASFTTTIPESMFLTHAPSALYLAYGLPRQKLRRMHRKLLEARPYVCWGLSEGPRRSVGFVVWEHINEYCDLGDDGAAAISALPHPPEHGMRADNKQERLDSQVDRSEKETYLSRENFEHSTKTENCDAARIPTYWINLDAQAERAQLMEFSLDKVAVDVDAHRVRATDCEAAAGIIEAAGVAITDIGTTLNKLCNMGVDALHSFFANRGRGTTNPVRVVELATTMSHVTSIWTAYTNNDTYAMILEDDVLLDSSHTDRFKPEEVRSLVADLEGHMPGGFLVQLYCNNPWKRTQELLLNKPRTAVNTKYFCHGTQQYVLSHSCMRSVLERYVPDMLNPPLETSMTMQNAFVQTLRRNSLVPWITEPAVYTVCPHFITTRPYGYQANGASDVQYDSTGAALPSKSPERLFDHFYANVADMEVENAEPRWNFLRDSKIHPKKRKLPI